MDIDQIKVGFTYYGFEYIDGRAVIKLYFVTKKNRWSFVANVRRCRSNGDIEYLGKWTGYPDHLYATTKDALAAATSEYAAVAANIAQTVKQEINMSHAVLVKACCRTCSNCDVPNSICTLYHQHIEDIHLICTDGGYSCDPSAINQMVEEFQVIK